MNDKCAHIRAFSIQHSAFNIQYQHSAFSARLLPLILCVFEVIVPVRLPRCLGGCRRLGYPRVLRLVDVGQEWVHLLGGQAVGRLNGGDGRVKRAETAAQAGKQAVQIRRMPQAFRQC